MITVEDSRDVAAWRGLEPHVLAELDGVAQIALDKGLQLGYYNEAVRSRARCLELRRQHGLGPFDKLRPSPD